MNKYLLFEKFPYLETEEIVLKKVEVEDLNDLYEVYNENLEKPKRTIEAVKNIIGYFERDFNKHKTIYLGIYSKNDSNKLVGIAEIYGFDYKLNKVDCGYTLNINYRGKGIATKATAMMLEYLFSVIDVNRIEAEVITANEKSKNVLRRNGFTYEGTLRQAKYCKDKKIADLEIYSILKQEYVK